MLTATPTATGHALRRARELAALRERAAARSLGIRRSRLREWEAGTVVPDADELARAVALYSADLHEIWPDRQPLVAPEEPGVLVVGDERIDMRDLVRVDPDGVGTIENRVALTRYLAAVRRQRGLGPTDAVELRASDIESLATVLDLEDAALESELAELLDLTPAGARWTTRAMVVGGLMAIGATAAVGTSWFAPAGATTAETAAPAPSAVFAPEVAAPPATLAAGDRTASPFAPDTVDPDAPVDAEVVTPAPDAANVSPFSTEPSATQVELAPAVFAVAPAQDWSPVEVDAPGELPPAAG